MSYASYTVDARPEPRTHFVRSERLITLIGACAFGATIGFALALAVGRYDAWTLFLGAAILLAVSLYPASANMADASWIDSPGCRFASAAHLAALLAWPLTIHVSGALAWLAPATAVLSLVLLASCWTGASRVVYRIGAQGVIVSGLAAHQGVMLTMGG
jgi:hypothetical protein